MPDTRRVNSSWRSRAAAAPQALERVAHVVQQRSAFIGQHNAARARSNNGKPNQSSSNLICFPTAQWVTCKSVAAPAKLP